MTFARRPPDPIDSLRVDLESAHEHLRVIREAVALRKVDASALHLAEYRYRDALAKWQAAVRGDDTGGAA